MRTKKFMRATFIVALVLISTGSFAQNGRFSVGAELGLPMGDFGDISSMGIGGTLRYELPMGDNLGLTATAGYMAFSGKEVGGFDMPDWTMIPVQIGAKYYFTEQQEGFYGMVELGVHAISYDFEYQVPHIDPTTFAITYTTETESVSDTKLSYAPAIGYHLANVDIGLRYQMIATEGSATSYLGIRLAYVFGEK